MSAIVAFPSPGQRLRLAARNDAPSIPSPAEAEAARSAFAGMVPAFAPWAGRMARVKASGLVAPVVGWLPHRRHLVLRHSQFTHTASPLRSYCADELDLVGPEPVGRRAAA